MTLRERVVNAAKVDIALWIASTNNTKIGSLAEVAAAAIIPIVLEEAAKVADDLSGVALKCKRCGDVRNTYVPGGCSGEAEWRQSEDGLDMIRWDGAYDAQLYFEKHLCRPVEMETQELAFEIAAAIRALAKDEI